MERRKEYGREERIEERRKKGILKKGDERKEGSRGRGQ